MKKVIINVSVLFLLSGLLTSCKNKEAVSPNQVPEAGETQTTENADNNEPEIEELPIVEDFEVELEEGEALGGG